jgi:hypothetical protein
MDMVNQEGRQQKKHKKPKKKAAGGVAEAAADDEDEEDEMAPSWPGLEALLPTYRMFDGDEEHGE